MFDDTGEIRNTIRDFEWRIDKFCSKSEKDIYYSSPCFEYDDINDWYLTIYPYSTYNDVGYIDLSLDRMSSDLAFILELSLSLKSIHGGKKFESHYTAIFEEGEEKYLIERFISRSELLKRQRELLPSDVLTIVCTMKLHESADNASGNSTKCPHCERNFNTNSFSEHQAKCMKRSIKCPDCFDDVVLQNWLYNHECQKKGAQDIISLCDDFQKIFKNGNNHDLILKVGETELKAHQDILRARSKVFDSMLSHDCKETNSGVIDIPDCDPQAVEQFLFYIYSGKVNKLDDSNMLKLYYVADKYDMNDLKQLCHDFIQKSISLINCCEVIQLALNHSDPSLLENATEYFIDNVLDIMYTVEWQIFLKNNSTVANELTIKSIKKLKNLPV